MFSEKYVQEVMKGVLGTPSVTYYEAKKANFKLARAKADAESMHPTDLSRDRVTGGSPRDMTDNVSRILEAEASYDAAKNRYFISILSLRHYLARARQLNLMDKTQALLWLRYYLKGEGSISLKKLADTEGLSTNRVDYLVRRRLAKQAFLDAVRSVLDDAEWTSPADDDAFNEEESVLSDKKFIPRHVDYNNEPIVYNYELDSHSRLN